MLGRLPGFAEAATCRLSNNESGLHDSAPDFDQQLSMCNDSVRVTNQNLKKFEFDGRQVHFRSSHEQSSFVEIHLDVARSKYRCLFAPSSSSARN